MLCSDKNIIDAWRKALLRLVLENYVAKLGLYVNSLSISPMYFPGFTDIMLAVVMTVVMLILR